MLTKGDDYPLHQTPEPVAYSGADRNFYDRYFFNGYSPDGELFFAAALGVYPQLNIMDAAFCLVRDGVQHNIRASKHLGSERLDLNVGPITLSIEEPLTTLRLQVEDDASGISADITFKARHAPVEEPRFTLRNGARMMMDYTRMTQNGCWSGTISHGDQTITLDPAVHVGTRDRSWGIRPVGASESQPASPDRIPQFYWLWMPFNFDNFSTFFHSNEDERGLAWNQRGAVVPLASPGAGDATEFSQSSYALSYASGNRRVNTLEVDYSASNGPSMNVTPGGTLFYMSGLGYLHPHWGHGMDHGPLETAYDTMDLSSDPAGDPLRLHVQALATAVLSIEGQQHNGMGVIEQLFLGEHQPSGLTGLLDPWS
ncbi:MAG: hypothetical protein ABJ056_01605 [Halioglobus sp.]